MKMMQKTFFLIIDENFIVFPSSCRTCYLISKSIHILDCFRHRIVVLIAEIYASLNRFNQHLYHLVVIHFVPKIITFKYLIKGKLFLK